MLPATAYGSGSPTLLFLHFFGSSRREWDQVIQILSPHYRCIAADAPGFGEAATLDGYTIEEMTQSLLAFAASAIDGPFVLVGHSMMGKVSMVAASRHPANLAGLILVAPSPLVPEPIPEPGRITMAEAQQSPATARAFFLNGAHRALTEAQITQGTDDALRANPTAWRRWPQSGTREDWSQAIPGFDLPALLIVGDQDQGIPPAFQKQWTLPHLKQGKLVVIPNAAHLLPYEAPGELAAHIQQFLLELNALRLF